MKKRCNNPNVVNFKYWGGRGITYDKKWESFSEFLADMEPTYKPGLSLDRINNNKNYCKENCRWATRSEQQQNRRDTRFYEYKGIKDVLGNWAKYMKIRYSTLEMRIYAYKWSFEKAITKGGIN